MGNSWYDALQTKVTKRYSHGLDLLATFTWQKELTTAEGTAVNDVFNRPIQKAISAQSQPLVFVTAFSYEVPKFGPNVVRQVLGGWTVGSMLRYASGLPSRCPLRTTISAQCCRATRGRHFANRVQGQPLFLQDLNCHCFDPTRTFALNPAAWADPAPGQFGASAPFYNRLSLRPPTGRAN